MSKKRLGKKEASPRHRSLPNRGRRLPLIAGGVALIVGIIAAVILWPGASEKGA